MGYITCLYRSIYEELVGWEDEDRVRSFSVMVVCLQATSLRQKALVMVI